MFTRLSIKQQIFKYFMKIFITFKYSIFVSNLYGERR